MLGFFVDQSKMLMVFKVIKLNYECCVNTVWFTNKKYKSFRPTIVFASLLIRELNGISVKVREGGIVKTDLSLKL